MYILFRPKKKSSNIKNLRVRIEINALQPQALSMCFPTDISNKNRNILLERFDVFLLKDQVISIFLGESNEGLKSK